MPTVNGIDRFEALAEQIVEGTFGKLFRSPLHPSEVMRRLARVMEDGALERDGRVTFPNRFHVWLSRGDFEDLNAREVESPGLEIERWLRLLARELSGDFAGLLEVTFHAKQNLRPGEMEITADRSPANGPSTDTREMAVMPAEHTRAVDWALALADQLLPLGQPVVRVGRSLDNDIILDDASVSRCHLELHWRENGYSLADQGSSYGTEVNGRRLEPGEQVRLQAGDRILVGRLQLTFARLD